MASGSELSPIERQELQALHSAWSSARRERDYPAADAIRAELSDYGCLPPDYAQWHPVFETPSHRKARLDRRVPR